MLSGLKILVAEDNPLNQKIATILLQKQGAEVTTVFDGQAAVNEIKSKPYDVVLMDIHMPIMDGYEATRIIRREIKSPIPVIALSASDFDDEKKLCIDAGMNECITKPFEVVQLVDVLARLKNKSQIPT